MNRCGGLRFQTIINTNDDLCPLTPRHQSECNQYLLEMFKSLKVHKKKIQKRSTFFLSFFVIPLSLSHSYVRSSFHLLQSFLLSRLVLMIHTASGYLVRPIHSPQQEYLSLIHIQMCIRDSNKYAFKKEHINIDDYIFFLSLTVLRHKNKLTPGEIANNRKCSRQQYPENVLNLTLVEENLLKRRTVTKIVYSSKSYVCPLGFHGRLEYN